MATHIHQTAFFNKPKNLLAEFKKVTFKIAEKLRRSEAKSNKTIV